MDLPCRIAIRKISKLGIVPKYTIIFGLVTFIISILIILTILFETRNNFEMTFKSRCYCFTNSLHLSINKITKLYGNKSGYIGEITNFIFKAEKSGNILYKKTEIKRDFNCKDVKNPSHIITFLPERSKYFKTCFKINKLTYINLFSPSYYQNKLYKLEEKVLIIFFLGFLTYLFIVYWIFSKLLSPIVCLSETMNNIELGEKCNLASIDGYSDTTTKDEISILIQSYCKMLNKLNYLYQERERLNKIMHRARKFATIGELVSGLAHEINNPLAGIKNCLYNLKKDLHTEKKERYIYLAEQAVKLIENLINKLLNFSTAPTTSQTEVNLKITILESVEFLKAKIKNNNININFNLLDNVVVLTNKYSLMQIFLNLLLNSIHSLKEKNIENKIIEISIADYKDFIQISFWDNGIGIKKEIRNKIFEPFFTTKKYGKGNGLGLFIIDGIVSALKYSIEVESEEDKWTKFIIKIPKKKK